MTSRPTMLSLARRYLAHRHKLGFLLRVEGPQVLSFARFADRIARGQPMTTSLALQWATLPRTAQQRFYHAKRLESLRGFARFCAVLDPRIEVPSTRLIGPAHRRRAPHIYTSNQVRLLLRRAAALPVIHFSDPLRPLTYVTLIGLIAATGLRMGEALRLREDDFDDKAGTLRVPRAKFSAERILPLHPSTVRALRRYQSARRRNPAFTDRFFAGRSGRPLNQNTVYYTFRGLTRNFVTNGDRAYPRFHDFRHSLATRLIAKWSRQKFPVAHRLLLLCRYLGHRHFRDTFWYVSSDPAALKTASNRFSRFCHCQPDPAYEANPVPIARSEVFCGPPDQPAQRQPANRRRLPRYLPSAPSIRLRSPAPPN